MTTWKSVLVLVATAAIACAPPAPRGERRDTNFITREELLASNTSNIYEAIAALRPNMLRSRGPKNFDPNASQLPHVFMDGQAYGDIETLRSLSVPSVLSVRFVSAPDATTKYGTNYSSGVIELTTR